MHFGTVSDEADLQALVVAPFMVELFVTGFYRPDAERRFAFRSPSSPRKELPTEDRLNEPLGPGPPMQDSPR